MPDIEIMTFRIHPSSPAAGKTIAEIELRKRYGVTLIAVQRERHPLTNLQGTDILSAGDIIVLLGTPERIAVAYSLFDAKADGQG